MAPYAAMCPDRQVRAGEESMMVAQEAKERRTLGGGGLDDELTDDP